MSTTENPNPLRQLGPGAYIGFALIAACYGGYRLWQNHAWISAAAVVERAERLCFHSVDSSSNNRAGSAGELLMPPVTVPCSDSAELSRLKGLGYNVVEPYWRLGVTYADSSGGAARATVTDWHRASSAAPYRPGSTVMIRHSPMAPEEAELAQE